MKVWRLSGKICAGVIVANLLACVGIAMARSEGLVGVRVTALDAGAEPMDHNLPLVKQHEALPDYELTLIDVAGDEHYLGVKPNQSAAEGIGWRLEAPMSLARLAAVRLQEKDLMVSDALAEVQVIDPSVESQDYRFEFETERSFEVGLQSFFTTPIGIAILGAFFLATFLTIAGQFGEG